MTRRRVYGNMLRLFLLLCLLQLSWAQTQSSVSLVKSTMAPVYREASEQSEQVTQVLAGDRLEVQSVKGGWARVLVPEQYRTPDGYPGWIRVEHIEKQVDSRDAASVTVAYPVVHLRGKPTVEAPIEESVYLATRLTLDAAAGERLVEGEQWLAVRWPGYDTPLWARASQVVKEAPLSLSEGETIIDRALLFEGTPYLWGGMTRRGIDCSGLVYTVYRVHGVTVPRDADQQFQVGESVSKEELQPGDLVFFGQPGDITHVGVYAGKGNFVHASSGSGVIVSPLFQGWYKENYRGARRILEEAAGRTRRMVPERAEVSR